MFNKHMRILASLVIREEKIKAMSYHLILRMDFLKRFILFSFENRSCKEKDRGKERRERPFKHWFTPQMITMTKAELI